VKFIPALLRRCVDKSDLSDFSLTIDSYMIEQKLSLLQRFKLIRELFQASPDLLCVKVPWIPRVVSGQEVPVPSAADPKHALCLFLTDAVSRERKYLDDEVLIVKPSQVDSLQGKAIR